MMMRAGSLHAVNTIAHEGGMSPLMHEPVVLTLLLASPPERVHPPVRPSKHFDPVGSQCSLAQLWLSPLAAPASAPA